MKNIFKSLLGQDVRVALTVQKYLETDGTVSTDINIRPLGKDEKTGFRNINVKKRGSIYTVTEQINVEAPTNNGDKLYSSVLNTSEVSKLDTLLQTGIDGLTSRYKEAKENLNNEIGSFKADISKKEKEISQLEAKILKLQKEIKEIKEIKIAEKEDLLSKQDELYPVKKEQLLKDFKEKQNRVRYESFITGCKQYVPKLVLYMKGEINGITATPILASIPLQDILSVSEVDYTSTEIVDETKILEEWGVYNVGQLFNMFSMFSSEVTLINKLPALGFDPDSMKESSEFYSRYPNVTKEQLAKVTMSIELKEQ